MNSHFNEAFHLKRHFNVISQSSRSILRISVLINSNVQLSETQFYPEHNSESLSAFRRLLISSVEDKDSTKTEIP